MHTPVRSKKKPKRAYIFWIFIVIAIPLAVSVLGYAAGYRIDRVSKSIIKTSALSVYSYPSNASVYIDNILRAEKTPFIATFAPGTYVITVAQEGYYDWSTTTTLTEQRSALFSHVVLFRKSGLERASNTALPEKSQRFEAVTKDQQLNMNLLPQFETLDNLRTLSGAGLFIVDDAKKSYAVTTTSLETVMLEGSGTVVAAEWHDNVLMIATSNEIQLFDTDTSTSTVVTRQTTPIIDAVLLPSGTHVIYSDTNGIYATEAYPHNVHAHTTLATHAGISALRISKNGKTLYPIIGTEVYTLEIQ